MPNIDLVKPVLEKRIDLTEFFGEEAYITIRRLNKYTFSFLANKAMEGMSARVFSKLRDMAEEKKELSEYNEDSKFSLSDLNNVKLSFTEAEVMEYTRIEIDVERQYFQESILPTGHNFTDMEGASIRLEGGSFYDNFSEIRSQEPGANRKLGDFLINEITKFNYAGITLGEQTGLK